MASVLFLDTCTCVCAPCACLITMIKLRSQDILAKLRNFLAYIVPEVSTLLVATGCFICLHLPRATYDVIEDDVNGDLCGTCYTEGSREFVLITHACAIYTFSEQLIIRLGFIRAISLALRLQPGGLCHAGPPCKSFIWINRHTSGRNRARPFGFASTLAYVYQANVSFSRDLEDYWITAASHAYVQMRIALWLGALPRIMARLAIICLIITCRCAWFVIEQPLSSNMLEFPYIRWLQKLLERIGLNWLTTSLPLVTIKSSMSEVLHWELRALHAHATEIWAGWFLMDIRIWSQQKYLAPGDLDWYYMESAFWQMSAWHLVWNCSWTI